MVRHGRIGAAGLSLIAAMLLGCGDSDTSPDGGADARVDSVVDGASGDLASAGDGPEPDAVRLWVGFGEVCGQGPKSMNIIRCLDSRLCIYPGQDLGYCTDGCTKADEGKPCTGGKAGELFTCALVDKLNDVYACAFACKRKASGGGNEETFSCPAPLTCNLFGQTLANGDEINLCAP
ncbi:MAG: hypothetical protein KC503_11765 [Myxococcales bacterium]|nr:hypothetical protein [Myxococcales bacterium]